MNQLKQGDRLLTKYNEIITFLEYYNENRAFDFIALTSKNKLRNYSFSDIKYKLRRISNDED